MENVPHSDAAADIDLNLRKRFTVHGVALMVLLTVAYTHDVFLIGIATVAVFVLCFLPSILLVQVQNGSAQAAKILVFLMRIYPERPKKHSGVCARIAYLLFAHQQRSYHRFTRECPSAADTASPYHRLIAPAEFEHFQKQPAMRLAEILYREAQAYEAFFIRSDPADRKQHILNVAIAHEELGFLYRFQGRFAEAVAHLTEARELARQAGDERVEGLAILRLAEIDHVEGRWANAEEGYNQAISLFRAVDDLEDLDAAQNLLSELQGK